MDDTVEPLAEQLAYYRAVAGEYDDHAIEVPGQRELLAAIDSFRPVGDVLELACGSPEMLKLARSRIGSAAVRFIEADLFVWEPDRRYDAVFFGFWISHVPDEQFEPFWSMVAEALKPGGRVFFFDDNHRTAAELIEGDESSVVERRLNDGTAFRVIKVPYRPDELERRLRRLHWDVKVTGTPGPFYWGTGGR